MNYRHIARVVDFLHRAHSGVHAQSVIQLENPVLGDLQAGTHVIVVSIVVGNQGVEVVVSAGQLKDDQDRRLAISGHVSFLLSVASLI